jgi:hypothetical protein
MAIFSEHVASTSNIFPIVYQSREGYASKEFASNAKNSPIQHFLCVYVAL